LSHDHQTQTSYILFGPIRQEELAARMQDFRNLVTAANEAVGPAKDAGLGWLIELAEVAA
jgi:hypothetical protein